MIGFSKVFSVCDFAIIFLEIPLCLYKTLVTQTKMTKETFKLPLFNKTEALSLDIIIFDLTITQEP